MAIFQALSSTDSQDQFVAPRRQYQPNNIIPPIPLHRPRISPSPQKTSSPHVTETGAWPGHSLALPAKPAQSYAHSRLSSLRYSAHLERRRDHHNGATPPYCPLGPSLSRHYVFEQQQDANGPSERLQIPGTRPPYRPSWLSVSPLVASASSITLGNGNGNGSVIRPAGDRMPHALSMPQTGFQALILCGPGGSLNTFTTVPKEYPKALISLANRPMVWYVLDWCYRMGVTNITLITPPESQATLSAALAQNPYLTSLPAPSPSILAPADLTHETATAELLRLPQVQASIVGDFLLLPCDLVCNVPGETFLEAWMSSLGGLGGTTDGPELEVPGPKRVGLAGELGSRRGGLSVWYSTVDREESVKGEECDFFATAKLDQEHHLPLSKNLPDSRSSRGILRKLVWAMPMSTLLDECDEDKDRSWKIRASLLAKYGSIRCLTRFRDAHIYLFPYWVKDFARLNEGFDSVSEDLVGTWAKADWRKTAYRARFGAKEMFGRKKSAATDGRTEEIPIEEEIDLMSLSSTQVSRYFDPNEQPAQHQSITFASRVTTDPDDSTISPTHTPDNPDDTPVPRIPPILSYIHSADPSAPLIRRIDNTPLLLSVSLVLAKIPALDESTMPGTKPHPSLSPFAHSSKIAATATIAARTTISKSDTLIGDNASVAEKCVIKESVVGPSASIGMGSRLTRCVVMDGAVIGERCTLSECVVGKKAVVGKGSMLVKCEVQDGNAIGEGTEGKDEKFLVGGLEDEMDEMDESMGLEADVDESTEVEE